MPLAFQNKAIDAAITIPPFTAQLLDGGHAVNFEESRRHRQAAPADHRGEHGQHRLRQAHKELMRNYYVGYLRAIRDYCQAYHGGPNRQAFIDLAIRTGTETRPELLHKYPWPARSPNGAINVASMLDMQAWYVKNKMSNCRIPGRPDRGQELHRQRVGEARAVGAREQGQQASGLPVINGRDPAAAVSATRIFDHA